MSVEQLTVGELTAIVRLCIIRDVTHLLRSQAADQALDELARRADLPWSYREANARADRSEKTLRFKRAK